MKSLGIRNDAVQPGGATTLPDISATITAPHIASRTCAIATEPDLPSAAIGLHGSVAPCVCRT